MTLDVASALRPCPGYLVSGDAVVVRVCEAVTVFGVIDALGHGPLAAEVADRATTYLDQVDIEWPLERIVDGLHEALARSRGAASALCRADADRMVDVCVVGNVEVRSVGSPISVVASPGILGRRVRLFRYHRSQMRVGDRVVVYSDGLSRVTLDSIRNLPPSEACTSLLERHGRQLDDAAVVIADFLP